MTITIKEMIAISRAKGSDHEEQTVKGIRFAVWRNNFVDRYDVFVRDMATQKVQKKISAKNAQAMLDLLISEA